MTTKDDAMQSSFTPGPWAFAKYSAKRFGLGQKGNGAFFFLQCVNDSADDPQARADARLIAAAPELLEALTVIQSQFESIASANWRKWEELASPEEFERWVKSRAAHMAAFARAAIAKATGEQA